MRGSHALDRLGLEVLIGVARRACGRLVKVSTAVDFAVDSCIWVDGASLVVLREHHEPLVLLFAVFGEKSTSFLLSGAGR